MPENEGPGQVLFYEWRCIARGLANEPYLGNVIGGTIEFETSGWADGEPRIISDSDDTCAVEACLEATADGAWHSKPCGALLSLHVGGVPAARWMLDASVQTSSLSASLSALPSWAAAGIVSVPSNIREVDARRTGFIGRLRYLVCGAHRRIVRQSDDGWTTVL